jgi:hypothetical protein
MPLGYCIFNLPIFLKNPSFFLPCVFLPFFSLESYFTIMKTKGNLLRICVFFISLGLSFLSGCKGGGVIKNGDKSEVPPPERIPLPADTAEVLGGIKIIISGYFWQDFMPVIPPEGPPFCILFKFKVTNNSQSKIENFSATLITLYYDKTKDRFYTFKLISSANTKPQEEILPKETKYLEYTNDRAEKFSPQLEEGTKLYGRILVSWNGEEHIFTCPPIPVVFTY